MHEKESLQKAEAISSSENPSSVSTVYEDLDKTDLKLKTDAESEKITQDEETISYPAGLKLFLLALVASLIFVMELLVRMNRLLNAP